MIKVLIVEDDYSIQDLYKVILKTLGIEVIGAADNGEEAIKLFKEAPIKPDIIIMDHRMPIKNGIEATKEIVSLYNHTKIIFASADITVKKRALEIGAVAFLEKPFSISTLRNEITKISKQLKPIQ